MTDSIHGHEVMHMMIDSGCTWQREALVAAVEEKFGKESRFHTCSATEMNAEDLIEFLEGRGKIIETSEGLTTTIDHVCEH
jgi:probable metal-binding protein